MEFLTYCIIFVVFYTIFDLIIRKTNVHNKLFAKSQKYKYTRTILILMLLFLAISLDYGKQLLNERYGKHNYPSIIVGAFLGSIYINFTPLIFKRGKS